jgi:hypothetical protein
MKANKKIGLAITTTKKAIALNIKPIKSWAVTSNKNSLIKKHLIKYKYLFFKLPNLSRF